MVVLASPPTITVKGLLTLADNAKPNVIVTGDVRRLRKPPEMKSATFELRFGVAMLYETDYIFPQLVIDDFAQQYYGRDGIAFMLDQGDAFPRADVMGVRKSTSMPEHLFMKQIDLARDLHCFANRNATHDTKLDAVVWIDPSENTWQSLKAADLRADDLLLRSVHCHTTNLTDLDKIIESVGSGR